MVICDKLSSYLSMLTYIYIYINVDECWLTSSMPIQRFRLQSSLNDGKILQNVVSQSVLMLKIALTWSCSIPIYWHLTSTNNGRHILHAWLDKDFRSLGMVMCSLIIYVQHISMYYSVIRYSWALTNYCHVLCPYLCHTMACFLVVHKSYNLEEITAIVNNTTFCGDDSHEHDFYVP